MKKKTLSLPAFEVISYGEMKKRLKELERSYKNEKDDDYEEEDNGNYSHWKVFYLRAPE